MEHIARSHLKCEILATCTQLEFGGPSNGSGVAKYTTKAVYPLTPNVAYGDGSIISNYIIGYNKNTIIEVRNK